MAVNRVSRRNTMTQNALSVVTRIKAGEVNALEAVLGQIGGDLTHNPLVPFPQFTTLHFACWVVLKRDPNFPPCLVLETNFDGSLDAHLDEWFQLAAKGLHEVYSFCEGCPVETAPNSDSLRAYLMAHRVLESAFYVGCYERPLDVIQSALARRQAIEGFLDTQQPQRTLHNLSPAVVFARIKTFLKTADAVPYTPSTPYKSLEMRSKMSMALWVCGAILLLPFLLVFLLCYAPFLRQHEKREAATPGPTPLGVDPRLFGKEDIYVQNHLTTLTNVKPGAFRLRTLKGILWIINLLVKSVFITGSLGGIPTIHFARWLLIDQDKRLLFFSNYDGSWASYLGDFVDKANYGLTSVWSNTDNFPPTHFLFFGGAQHIEDFKAWSRRSNEYAAVWYSAYPDATVRNITEAVQISETFYGTLHGMPDDNEIAACLKKL